MTSFPPGIPPEALTPPVVLEPEPPMSLVLLFDKQHIVEGVVCIESALTQNVDLRVYILALDVETQNKLVGISDSIVVIPLPELEARFPAIAATKTSRPWPAYVNSLKPFLPDFVFSRYHVRLVACVDSDMYFYQPVSALLRVIGSHSFAVVAAEAVPTARVLFNDGLFIVRNTMQGRAFLRWWQGKVTEWCLCEHGPQADQSAAEGYLSVILRDRVAHPGVSGVRFPGANLSSWNLNAHTLAAADDGRIVVDEAEPLVCYHFFGFQDDRQPYDPGKAPSAAAEQLLFCPYHAKLVSARVRLEL